MSPAVLHALVPVLAAEGEKSKTAFYVAGAILAVWAVAVSALGVKRPDFPASPMLARAVMGVSALLVLGAVTTAVVTASKPPKESEARANAGGEGTGGALKVAAPADGSLKFEQARLSAKAGEVKIDFDNPAQVAHNVTLELNGKRVAATKTIMESKASLATMLKPGRYTFYCSVGGHREAGMKGTLTVR